MAPKPSSCRTLLPSGDDSNDEYPIDFLLQTAWQNARQSVLQRSRDQQGDLLTAITEFSDIWEKSQKFSVTLMTDPEDRNWDLTISAN